MEERVQVGETRFQGELAKVVSSRNEEKHTIGMYNGVRDWPCMKLRDPVFEPVEHESVQMTFPGVPIKASELLVPSDPEDTASLSNVPLHRQ